MQEEGESYADVVKKLLEDHKEILEDIRKRKYDEGYKTGFDDAKKKYRVWYNCAACGKELPLMPETRVHTATIALLKSQKWVCNECYEKGK